MSGEQRMPGDGRMANERPMRRQSGGGADVPEGGFPRQPGDSASRAAGRHASGHAAGAGGGRRRAGAPEFGPAELAAALHGSVAGIGASGPPRAGLARIKRRAKARKRRHTVMAGSAGVLMLAVAVSALTGNSLNIVPVLTGVVGLGGGAHGSSDEGANPRGSAQPQVRTVRPPADAAGKKGPAIGPAAAAAGVPTAIAATGLPQCAAADLTTVTTVDAVIGGVSYGHVEAVAQRTCAVAGPPVLQVENAAGTAASSVVILQHQPSDGSRLPNVATWGAVLKLQAGQGYDLQFAWAPDGCAGGASTPSASGGAPPAGATTAPAGGGTTGSADGKGPASAYTLSYLVGSATPTEPVDLAASCGATVYVTDIYPRGEFPLAKPPASPSAQPSASSAPASSTPPATTAAPSSAPPVASSSPATPSAAPSTTATGPSAVGSPAAGVPTASAPSQSAKS